MSNLYDDQLSFDDFFADDEVFTAPEKKEEPKKEKKAAPKQETKKELFRLPVNVQSGYCSLILDGEGEITLAELKERLYSKSNMFAPKLIKVDSKDDKTVTVKFKSLPRADYKFDKNYTIVLNDFKIEISPDDEDADIDAILNGEETEESSDDKAKDLVEAAEAAWLKQYPDFEGCSFIIDDEKAIIVPIMQQNVTDSIEIPFSYEVFGGESGTITEEDIKPNSDNKVLYIAVNQKLKERLGVDTGLFKSKSGTYYAVPTTEGSASGKNSNSTKKAQKMVKTDITVCIYGEKIKVTPNDFKGKEEVTEKEFLKWICSAQGGGHDEYSVERGSWIDIDEKNNYAIPRFPAAKKGAGYTIETVDGVDFRVQKTMVGNFRVRNDVLESPANSFHYNLPKIPEKTWRQITSFFA